MKYTTILSIHQSELLENLIAKHGNIVTFDNILTESKEWWDYKQSKNLITTLIKHGWLIRIKKGLYAISDLSTRGWLSLSSYVVANLLTRDSYVSFESALHHHGMFDQLTDTIISVSLKAHKTVRLQNIEYSFVKTKADYYFGWQEVILDNTNTRIATTEKALIDMVHFHKSTYAIDLVIEKLREHKNDLNFTQLNEYVSKMSMTTIKIFGFIFDLLELDSAQLLKYAKKNNGAHRMITNARSFNAKWRLYYDAYFDKYRI